MANWRQIQARIRKVKDTPEAAAKLGELYAKTRDAMVAFELAAVEERAAHNEEAIHWYKTAHQRFRRQDWKRRVEEALTRLGATLPETHAGAGSEPHDEHDAETGAEREADISVSAEVEGAQDSGAPDEEPADEAALGNEAEGQAQASSGGAADSKRRRRRGRRGGRGRRRGSATTAAPGGDRSAQAGGAPQRSMFAPEESRAAESAPPSARQSAPSRYREPEPERAAPMLPSERVAHGRGGDPAIASRLSHLESLLQRLLGSQLHTVDQSDEAPAGPGVFLISDSDLVTSYYVESCKTLRIALGQLLRGGRTRREGGSFKSQLAEHLEINESKVTDYLKKHCVVRWIQLDDEAPHFAHFAVGVLRTPLNAE